MKADPPKYVHNVGLLKNGDFYLNLRASETKGTPDQVARNAIDHMKANLRFLYEQAQNREANKLWYDGARAIVDNRVQRYGFNDASVAGVYAALSPQMDWNKNVYLGDELLHIYATRQDTPWDEQMEKTATSIWSKANQKIVDQVRGKTLRELDTPELKALWIRTYNEAHTGGALGKEDNSRFYRLVRPDGTQGAFIRNKDGTLATATWGALDAVTAAVQALEADGDRNKISDAMGGAHKVRSFYNNILDPHSPNGDVTIDTHAVGAAWLRPIGGHSAAVSHNFGNSIEIEKQPPGWQATRNSTVTGNRGTYGLYAEAYRELAKELSIESRQLQSIVWVAKKGMFDHLLSNQKQDIEAEWKRYQDDPNVKLADVQKRILEISGGIRKEFDWYFR